MSFVEWLNNRGITINDYYDMNQKDQQELKAKFIRETLSVFS